MKVNEFLKKIAQFNLNDDAEIFVKVNGKEQGIDGFRNIQDNIIIAIADDDTQRDFRKKLLEDFKKEYWVIPFDAAMVYKKNTLTMGEHRKRPSIPLFAEDVTYLSPVDGRRKNLLCMSVEDIEKAYKCNGGWFGIEYDDLFCDVFNYKGQVECPSPDFIKEPMTAPFYCLTQICTEEQLDKLVEWIESISMEQRQDMRFGKIPWKQVEWSLCEEE